MVCTFGFVKLRGFIGFIGFGKGLHGFIGCYDAVEGVLEGVEKMLSWDLMRAFWVFRRRM